MVGAGSFTIDIGDVLGEYVATDVTGSGAGFGTWTSVIYRSFVGEYPVVRIYNALGGGAGFQAGSLGGDLILPGSEADLEWEHLLNDWRRAGVKIEVQSAAVPEASTWVAGASLALAGLLMARRRG